ncbi:MAG: YlmC/YmxH family sporulation protein [Clostridiales bacterium]|nr:YlmC/YmxH family sporulation protein [Clostridiales bacterium]
MFKINDLKSKEVINISDGARLGFVHDAEFDSENGNITSIIIPGSYKFMGIFGKENDLSIPWENIEKIGEDLIIVKL